MSAQHRANPPEIQHTVRVVFEQTALVMFAVMRKYATKSSNMTLLCVFNGFWMTMQLHGTEE